MKSIYNYDSLDFDDSSHIKKINRTVEIHVKEPSQRKLGIMIVGLGGNNGSTFLSSIIAKQKKLKLENKDGIHDINFYGSIYEYGSINLGYKNNLPVTKLIKETVNFRNIEDIFVDGWDICKDNLYDACKKNKILELDLLKKLENDLKKIKPLPSIYYESFIAKNQEDRVNNIKTFKNNKWKDLFSIKSDIESFKIRNNIDNVIVLWSASTERYSKNIWNNWSELSKAIARSDPEVSPSTIFAVASIMSGAIFINGSPQNTISPAILELALNNNTFVGGEDFKTGQTKLKSVLVDFLASSGIKPLSIVSYNHLGNNDGRNLVEEEQFKSKEITKRNVIDDVYEENKKLFNNQKPNHEIVIKYVPAVGDSKRAIDEYYSELFLNGKSTISIYNVCEDTLLAVPLMLDIIMFAEFLSRVEMKENDKIIKSSNLNLLSLFFKSPINDNKTPIINSFFRQKYALENFIKMCAGIPLNDFVNIYSRY